MAELGLGLLANWSPWKCHTARWWPRKISALRQPGLLSGYHFHTIGKQKHLSWSIHSLGYCVTFLREMNKWLFTPDPAPRTDQRKNSTRVWLMNQWVHWCYSHEHGQGITCWTASSMWVLTLLKKMTLSATNSYLEILWEGQDLASSSPSQWWKLNGTNLVQVSWSNPKSW